MDISVAEYVEILKRSSLPTIVVEGVDDIVVYRYFEDRLSAWGVSLMPVGGRGAAIDIFKRREELSHLALAFVVDRDSFVHTGVPDDLNSEILIFTDGYSIENDVFRDGELFGLLRADERDGFLQELTQFLEWYALAMSRRLSGMDCPIATHPDRVFAEYESLTALGADEEYPQQLLSLIREDYQKVLRGKSLMPLLVRKTNYKGRVPRHNSHAMLEMVAARPGALLNGIYGRIVQALNLQASVQVEVF